MSQERYTLPKCVDVLPNILGLQVKEGKRGEMIMLSLVEAVP